MNIHLQIFEKKCASDYKIDKLTKFRRGDTIEVKTKTEEGGKVKIQTFQGIVIQRRHPGSTNETFTVKKFVGDIAVERVFHISSPSIVSINVIKSGIVKRARLFYLRDNNFKKKIKVKFFSKKNKDNSDNISENIDNNNSANVNSNNEQQPLNEQENQHPSD